MTWPCPVQPGVGHFDPSAKVMERERELISFVVLQTREEVAVSWFQKSGLTKVSYPGVCL